MKKFVLIFVVLAAVGVLAWFVWFKPAAHAEEPAHAATDVPVQVGKITRATLRSYVTGYGTVEPEPAGERPAASARVASAVAGVIAFVHAKEGAQVEKGAPLFDLDLRVARVAVDFATKALDRQKELLRVEGTSQKNVQEAEQQLAAARAQQALLSVVAPLAGTIVRVNARLGEAVDLTSVLAEIVDLDRLVVSAVVPATEVGSLKPGQPAEVAGGASAAPVATTLIFISPQVDPKTGTVVVRAAVPAHSGLRPGQFVTLRIVSEEHPDRLAVPTESVVQDGEAGSAIAVVQGDKAVRKPVKVGLRDGDRVEIEAEGLKEGDVIVTVGAYGLPKETKIRVAGK